MRSVFWYFSETANRGRSRHVKKKNDQKYDAHLDARVQDYIQDFKMNVEQNLESTKMLILMERNPSVRACLKTNIETLNAVLDLLHGKREEDPPTVTRLREEIADLKEKLKESHDARRRNAESLFIHKKMTVDFKFQLNEAYKTQNKIEREAERREQDLLHQLKEAQLIFDSKLSHEASVNMDLRRQLRDAHKQLRQHRRENVHNAGDSPGMKTTEEEKEEQEEEEIADAAAAQTWQEKKTTQMEQKWTKQLKELNRNLNKTIHKTSRRGRSFNKCFARIRRYGGQDCSDWQSTKDSGHGESEAGDMDWEPGRDSPIDPQLEEGLNNLLNNPDDVFSEVSDPSWMARLSLPLSGDYHDNVFVPTGPPSPESERLPRDCLDSSSFSTFGKTPDKDGPLGGALLSEVSTLFEMLMTQKADAHPGPRPDVLYRLSAAYRRSLGLDGGGASTPAGGAGNAVRSSGNTEKRLGLAGTLPVNLTYVQENTG